MKRERIVVERGEQPPERMTVEGVRFTYDSKAYNRSEDITHYVYRAQSGWLISFTDRQFAVGLEVDPNRKSDWWPEGHDDNRVRAAKSVPKTITSPAWSIRPRKTKKKQEAQDAPKKKRTRKGGKVKSEDLFL